MGLLPADPVLEDQDRADPAGADPATVVAVTAVAAAVAAGTSRRTLIVSPA
jgi:hypothetical protein